MKRWTLACVGPIGLSLAGCSGGDPAPPAPAASSEAPASTAPSCARPVLGGPDQRGPLVHRSRG